MSQFESEMAVLSELLGKTLVRCTAERSSFEGATDPQDANRLALELSGNQYITLDLGGDGQSLTVSPTFALAKEWSDWPYGSVHEPYSVIGEPGESTIVAVRCVTETYGGTDYLAGVWVLCDGGFQIGFYNYGDSGWLAFDMSLPEIDDGMTRRIVELRL